MVSIRLTLAASLLFAAACGGPVYYPEDRGYSKSVEPGTRAPASALEETLLPQLADLGPTSSVSVDGHTVSASEPYDAASGKRCKHILIDGAQSALACEMDQGWRYVPTIRAQGGST